jgi:hypothetical protein
VSGIQWLVVPGVAMLVLGWVILDRANIGVRRGRRNSMFVLLGGFVLAFVGLLVSMLGVRAFDDQSGCDDGRTVEGVDGYCSDFRGGD